MCSLSFCRMEVHHGIRNARLQGDYSDYALTEPCPLRSTDDPSGSKDVPGRALVTWTNRRRKQAKRSKGARSSRHRSIDHSITHSIDLQLQSIDHLLLLDRSHAKSSSIDPMQSDEARSIPFCFSRSINPGQMISQPFDLLGANRLDRTTANRIEPKSTPELFRPIFSHCLGYAVFQSFTLLFIVSEGEEIKPLFSQFGEDF
ncbi:unnamed protein product [Microthlaspi erraticum]|uniref:Uncharacterized protein n=1 Tax=Microthlaspi erraticum TaxID=1685480 RepID=A0A6D2K6J7_9BRAS|nr:unnamed protein product [Microthlaspi erraticum]